MKWKNTLLLLSSLIISGQSQAGVTVGGTRLIYDANKKEASLPLYNPDKNTPYLIQSWVENLQTNNSQKTPFIITPPLFRLDAQQESSLRVMYTGGLPADRESMFWLNIKSIPSTSRADINRLLITVRARIKLIYRPAGLTGKADEAYKALIFSQQGPLLNITNPTPYYITFYSLKVGGKEVTAADQIAPKESVKLPLAEGMSGKVQWQAITDYGGISDTAHQ